MKNITQCTEVRHRQKIMRFKSETVTNMLMVIIKNNTITVSTRKITKCYTIN